MSVLVLDGVRRHPRGGQVIRLRPLETVAEAVMPLPQTWTPGTGALDGLRRVAQTVAAPIPQEFDYTQALPDTKLSRLAIASLATIPMIVAASAIAARDYLSRRPAIAATNASAASATQAQPVSPDTQAALAPVPAETQSLQQLLDNFGRSSTYSLYVKDLKTGQLAVVGPDRVFESASLYKLFVASAIYHEIDTGQLSYTAAAGGGTGSSIAGCLNLMITISDNGCGRALGGLIGWSSLTQMMHAQGYDATNLTGEITYTTPRNVAMLFERLYSGTLLSNDSTSQFMNLLKAQKVNNRLPQGLPAGTTFAHKTGDLDGYMHDGGIVFGPKTDYLVVMMGAPSANPNDFAQLSAKLYGFFNQ